MSSRINVLIVDDDPGMRDTLEDILEDLDYTVAVAEDGRNALATVRKSKGKFDVVILDINMPGLNGVETLRQLKSSSPELQVLMMTAFTDPVLLDEARRAGASSILSKPLDIGKVLEFLDSLTDIPSILVVDDESAVGNLIIETLKRKKLSVTYVASGEEALKLARQRPFRIAFIDVFLPGINGIETVLALKETSPQLTCILMTGYPEETEELLIEAQKGRIHTCLHKPIDTNMVSRLVEHICK